jgi:succinate dehydrogenase / fumarate reductase cytochrome b subunit
MSTLILTAREALRYKGKEGQLAWIGHRLAGLGTLLFFVIHVVDTSWVYFWPEGYGHAIDLYRSWPFQIGELFLVLAVIYHGLNGLRVALMDLKPGLWQYQRQMTLGVFGLTALFYAPAFIIMGSHTLKNLLGIELF